MTILALALVLAKWAAQLWLEKLNQSHVLANSGAVPDALKDSIDPDRYAKSIDYTLAKSRLGIWEDTWNTVVLLAVLFSGALPRGYDLFANRFGGSAWAQAAFLFVVGVALSIGFLGTPCPFRYIKARLFCAVALPLSAARRYHLSASL